MENELEPVSQQRLKHRHQALVSEGLFGSCCDLETVGVDPIGAAENAIGSDSVGAGDASLERDVRASHEAGSCGATGWGVGFVGIARVDDGGVEARRAGIRGSLGEAGDAQQEARA